MERWNREDGSEENGMAREQLALKGWENPRGGAR